MTDVTAATAPYTEAEQRTLLEIARRSIEEGFATRAPHHPRLDSLPSALTDPGASFVTLYLHGQLQGCTGTLEPRRALAADVAENAFHTAFHDTRFETLRPAQLASAEIEISVLTPISPLPVTGEAELLARLRPGVDGLVIEQGYRHATFLPKVWESLPEPAEFLAHLKRKGGIARWTRDTRAFTYQTATFAE